MLAALGGQINSPLLGFLVNFLKYSLPDFTAGIGSDSVGLDLAGGAGDDVDGAPRIVTAHINAVLDRLDDLLNMLAQIVDAIQNIQTLAVNAGNATQTAEEKKMLNTELQGRYQELLGLANSTDGNGVYLFSGFQGGIKPFTESAYGQVSYNGDEGVRKIQISSGRQIPISENGNEVFRNIKNGNGTFVTAAGTANTGSGVVSDP